MIETLKHSPVCRIELQGMAVTNETEWNYIRGHTNPMFNTTVPKEIKKEFQNGYFITREQEKILSNLIKENEKMKQALSIYANKDYYLCVSKEPGTMVSDCWVLEGLLDARQPWIHAESALNLSKNGET